MPAWILGALAVSFLLGAVPTAWLAGRWLLGLDLRRLGSGNVGATNLSRQASSRPRGLALFLVVFLLDAAKGLAAATVIPWAYLAGGWSGQWLAAATVACAAAAVAGHVFTPFLGFRGGKGVATGFGAAVGLTPLPAAAAAAIWLSLVLVTGYVSLGSMIGAAGYAAACLLLLPAPRTDDLPRVVFALVVGLGVIVAHRSNMQRLAAGTENNIWRKEQKAAS